MRVYLVEPAAQGRVSGGYLYNRRLAEAGPAISVVSATMASLAQGLAALELAASDWLLLDSLFLEPTAFAAFADARRRTGCRLGLVLHAFPSFVERADRGDKANLVDPRPTESELELLGRLDVVVCPGPYGERVIRQSGVDTPIVTCPAAAIVPVTGVAQRTHAAAVALPLRLLTVGNVTRGKGYQDALDALEACKDLDWRWQIIGGRQWDPNWVAELERRALEAGLGPRVHFLGQLSPEATCQYYLDSDVFLLASFTENHPLVVLEARAHGLPIVAYRVGGVPDIVAGGGLLASPFDVTELGTLLRRVLSDADERARLRRIALRASDDAAKWSESAMNLYRQLQALGAPQQS